MTDYLKQGWLVLVLALVFGAALAGVEASLSERIARNKLNDTLSRIPVLVPKAVDGKDVVWSRVTVEKEQVDQRVIYRVLDSAGSELMSTEKIAVKNREVFCVVNAAGDHVGWVLPANGLGFADKIEIIIGLDETAERITGLAVLSQKETPEVGSKIETDADWARQFAGEATGMPLAIETGGAYDMTANGKIVGISGATVSSDSVRKIVNTAVAEMAPELRKQKIPTGAPRGTPPPTTTGAAEDKTE